MSEQHRHVEIHRPTQAAFDEFRNSTLARRTEYPDPFEEASEPKVCAHELYARVGFHVCSDLTPEHCTASRSEARLSRAPARKIFRIFRSLQWKSQF